MSQRFFYGSYKTRSSAVAEKSRDAVYYSDRIVSPKTRQKLPNYHVLNAAFPIFHMLTLNDIEHTFKGTNSVYELLLVNSFINAVYAIIF